MMLLIYRGDVADGSQTFVTGTATMQEPAKRSDHPAHCLETTAQFRDGRMTVDPRRRRS